jgi:hypothetical protein
MGAIFSVLAGFVMFLFLVDDGGRRPPGSEEAPLENLPNGFAS